MERILKTLLFLIFFTRFLSDCYIWDDNGRAAYTIRYGFMGKIYEGNSHHWFLRHVRATWRASGNIVSGYF